MASNRNILLALLACLFFSSYSISVEGGRRLLHEEEDVEFEKQLKLINKPAIKSIQTKYGDIYDCVDFYKQPAFDHPLLKNHTFHPQMRPSSMPNFIREKGLSKVNSKTSEVGLQGVGCPSGTVPIRRVTKHDLIREKLHSEKFGNKYNLLDVRSPGVHYAVVMTQTFPKNDKYTGGGASISIYEPSASGAQYSSARMQMRNNLESIEMGWTVNPTLYGDNRTRQYIYLKAGESQCFNTQCPGFIIVNTDYFLGGVLPASRTGEKLPELKFLVYKDEPIGNWWLTVGEDNTKIGFWPQRIFTGLANFATFIEWGGQVFSPPDVPSPPMGSGKFPGNNNLRDAYCAHIITVDEDHQVVNDEYTIEVSDTDRYEPVDVGNVDREWGHQMFFGGPGGATGK